MLTDSSPSHLAGACCARHMEAPAVAICSRCGSFTCIQCLELGQDGHPSCRSCFHLTPLPASRSTRFIANFIDSLAWGLPLFAAGALAGLYDRDPSRALLEPLAGLAALISFTVLGVQLYLCARSGQSIGKRAFGLRVVRNDGSRASSVRIVLLRNFIPLFIGNLCGLFALIDALLIFGEERRCLHDLLADTRVVRVSPPVSESDEED